MQGQKEKNIATGTTPLPPDPPLIVSSSISSAQARLSSIATLIVKRDALLKELYCMEQAATSGQVDELLDFDHRKVEPRDANRFKEYQKSNYVSEIPVELQKAVYSFVREEKIRLLAPVERPVTRHYQEKNRSGSNSREPSPQPPTKHELAPKSAKTDVVPRVTQKRRFYEQEPMKSAYDLYAFLLRIERKPMVEFLQHSRKVLNTTAWDFARHELIYRHVLRRIETLKAENRWSLKQPKRFTNPGRAKTPRDYLLDEAKWMALDFREERKWKIAAAFQISQEVLQWHQRRRGEVPSTIIEPAISLFQPKDIKPVDMEQVFTPLTDNWHIDDIDAVPIHIVSRVAASKTRFIQTSDQQPHVFLFPPNKEGFYCAGADQLHSIFHTDEKMDQRLTLPLNPPSHLKNRPAASWTSEEDEILLKQAKVSHNNWVYIAEYLNTKGVDKSTKKTLWDCATRFEHLKHLSSSSRSVKTRHDDMKRRAGRHAHLFDGLAKLLKKRDHQKQKNASNNKDSSTSTVDAPKQVKVNLNAHVSHQGIATKAGVDTETYKTPLDLNERRIKLNESAKATQATMLQQQQALPLMQPSNRQSVRPLGAVPSTASSAAAPRPPALAIRPPGTQMSMTPAQVQRFLQQQALLRAGGSAPLSSQATLTPQQLAQMPPQVAQRLLLARQQQLQQASTASQKASMVSANARASAPATSGSQLTPEMLAALDEAKKTQSLLVNNLQQRTPDPPPPLTTAVVTPPPHSTPPPPLESPSQTSRPRSAQSPTINRRRLVRGATKASTEKKSPRRTSRRQLPNDE